MPKDFQDRFLDLLQDNFQQLKADLQDNTDKQAQLAKTINKIHAEVRRTNGRVTELEKKMGQATPQTIQQLPQWYRDPQILKVLGYLALAILIGTISLAGFNVTDVLGM